MILKSDLRARDDIKTMLMKKISRYTAAGILAILTITLTGCTTTAGPFVTNISSDGKGNIMVEKNTVTVNGFTGTVNSGDHPTQEVIKVVSTPAQP